MSKSILEEKNGQFTIKVSSTLNNDVKSWGKQHLIDRNQETCWNSDQGEHQFVILDFSQASLRAESMVFALTFQGGFAATECQLLAYYSDSDAYSLISTFNCQDSNDLQLFPFRCHYSSSTSTLKKLKIVFTQSTDFYGRITLYHVDVLYAAS